MFFLHFAAQQLKLVINIGSRDVPRPLLANESATAPVPVPKSTMRASSGKSKRNTVSTSTSVSGRGT